MTRTSLAALGLAALGLTISSSAAADARFDDAQGSLVLSRDAAFTLDFETADGLVGAELTTWQTSGGIPVLLRDAIKAGTAVDGDLTQEPGDAVEGSHALRLAKGKGLALSNPAIFEPLANGKVEISMWIRADGVAPFVTLVYDKDVENAFSGFQSLAQARAIRTGRQTDDGWAEFSSGVIDGSIWGAPLRGVVVTASPYADGKGSFLLDALEVKRRDGALTEAKACTQADVDATCGEGGDCMFGHCVSSAFTWGTLPSPAHRAEIAERWVFWSTRVIGDRNASMKGRTILTDAARALARDATSSRQFFGGLVRLVNLLRDNHTSFGTPVNFTGFAPQVQSNTSSSIGACFGLVEKDVLGGGLGYAVYKASSTPTSGVVLKIGDVLTSIDGQDPKAWVDANWPSFATTMPNDPESDWGPSAVALARLVVTRAKTITLTRCASSTCDAAARETVTVDVGNVVYELLRGERQPGGPSFSCSTRFIDAVASVPEQTTQEDPIGYEIGAGGETRVQFDGFVGGGGSWEGTMTNIFGATPAKVLVDARMGHGGYYSSLQHLFDLVRGTSEPIGVIGLGRPTYDLEDPFGLFDSLASCVTDQADQWRCFSGMSNGFFASQAAPPGVATKLAWVNTYDVSANDFMPRLLKGRSNTRIFAPHPTSGAFGAVVSLPAVAPGWIGGSIQIQDSRFAETVAAAASARWESGHGVIPDQVVVQKLSDTLNGNDTLLQAAEAWLATP